MRGWDLLDLAWVGLRRNRLRTFLTSLGVCVGVFALTTIVAIGSGLERSITKELTDGENPLRMLVRPGFGPKQSRKAEIKGVSDPLKADRLRKAIAKRRRGGPGQRKRKQLTLDAIAAITSREHVSLVRPLAIDRFKARLGEQELDGAISFGIRADEPRWQERVILGAPLTETRGVWLHEYLLYRWGFRSDEEQRGVVGKELTLSRPYERSMIQTALGAAQAFGVDVPVDPKVAEGMARMFGGLKPQVGKKGELVLQVPIVGVIRERIEEDGFDLWEDSFSMQADIFFSQGFSEELFAQVPSNVARGYTATAVLVDDIAHVREVEKALKAEGYRIMSIGTVLERVGQATAMLTAVVTGLSGIALLVAMLGIVNTMIMNVSERTKEIGVLKAVGATDRQVRGLFLVESAIIGFAGGLAGIGLALAASIPGDAYVRYAIFEVSNYHYYGSVFRYSPYLLGGALAFAVGLSVTAALGPSTRASKIDPVRALRDE
jgi:ABC-type lipoprotein release transport system permease subunit